MRRRINISISPELYEDLQRISKDYGFKNVCQVNVALLRLLVQFNRENSKALSVAENDERDIADMFQDFSAWERTPDGTVPVRHPHRDID